MLVILFLLPVILRNEYQLRVLNTVALYSIAILSVNLIVGFCGLLDFGRSAFVGLGGYFSAIMMMRFGFPFIVAFLSAGLFCALMGAVLALLCRNTTFDYLSLVTIGFSEIVRMIFLNWSEVTNGALGITKVPNPSFFGFEIAGNTKFYYFSVILLILSYIAIRRVVFSKWGRSFEAIRDDEIAASYSGINIANFKLKCFAIGSFFTGIAGSAMVHYAQYASPYNYTIDDSLILDCRWRYLGGLGGLAWAASSVRQSLIIAPEMSRTVYQYRLMIVGDL